MGCLAGLHPSRKVLGYTTSIVRVTDDGSPALFATNTFEVTVNEANTSPVLDVLNNQVVSEEVLLQYLVSATDGDEPLQELSFTLDGVVPAGASITTNGLFSWTPGELHGPGIYNINVRVTDDGTPALFATNTFEVTVNEANLPPTIGSVSNLVVIEQQLLLITNVANDVDLPTQNLSFTLDGVVPSGASIDAGTGVIAWTPSESQGPGVYDFSVRVTDDGAIPLFATNSFQITVNESNAAPVFAGMTNQVVDEEDLLQFVIGATDDDLPTQGLFFSLDGLIPAGASIATNGVFSWTPSEAQGPGIYDIHVRVTDDGPSALFATNTFEITVNEANKAPVLGIISNQLVDEEVLLEFNVIASDEDEPSQNLTFSLDGMVPTGAVINATNGTFSWTPSEAQGPGIYDIVVRVSDDGIPAQFSTNSFQVRCG